MEEPTAAQIRARSQTDFEELGWEIVPADPDADPPVAEFDPLDRVVAWMNIWLQDTVGREYGDIDADSALLADRKLVMYMEEAARMATEYTAYVSQPDIVETAADFNQIQSFSAGSYSETRRSVNATSNKIHPYEPLAALLWALMTDEKRAPYENDGPALGVVEPRWDVGRDIMDAQRENVLGPFGPMTAPWDALPPGPW